MLSESLFKAWMPTSDGERNEDALLKALAAVNSALSEADATSFQERLKLGTHRHVQGILVKVLRVYPFKNPAVAKEAMSSLIGLFHLRYADEQFLNSGLLPSLRDLVSHEDPGIHDLAMLCLVSLAAQIDQVTDRQYIA